MNIAPKSRWKHYKGKYYIVLAVARDESSESDLAGRLLVVYHEEDRADTVFARDISEWTQSMAGDKGFRFSPASPRVID